VVKGCQAMLVQPAALGYNRHPIVHQAWKYIDIEAKDQE
jgi:oligopeptide transport system substrate-binding protein